MPKSCCVQFCTANKLKNYQLKFYILPNQKTEPERRTRWLQAIKRKDDSGRLWHPTTKHVYVCSQHFITGLKNEEKDHPDYTPSIFPARKMQPAAANLRCLEPPTAPGPGGPASDAPRLPQSLEKEILKLRREQDEARKERDEAAQQLKKINFSVNSVRGNDTRCQLMTGLTWTLFDILHQHLVQFVEPREPSRFSTEDELFITLVKLRQNPPTDSLCGILDLAHGSFLDVFSRWLHLLYAKISFLIAWPDRECIRNTVPADVLLQYPRLTSIIHCFEVRIQHSKKLKTRAMHDSKSKNWTRVKYFIAYHPCGAITYVSRGLDGRAPDVHIVRNSGFLSQRYLHAGDQILADRGFTLREDFAALGVQLITPSFPWGRKQLSAEEDVTSKIRVHIERVVGSLNSRFLVLDGPVPLGLVRGQEREEATIDRIVHVCAALMNMSGSLMYNSN